MRYSLCYPKHGGKPQCVRLLLALALLGLTLNATADSTPTLNTVPEVDLNRYVGTWYEIARLPNWFQKKCSADVVATYTLLPDGRVSVVNSCKGKNGLTTQAEGIARRATANGPNSKLKVRFAPKLLSFLPFVWGDYWIISLASDYSYAAVGEPSRKYLWILSRAPQMEDALLQSILDEIKRQGYDLSGLIRTEQAGQ